MLVLCRAFSYSNIQATPANLQAPSLQSEPFNLGEASRERERERERERGDDGQTHLLPNSRGW